MEFEITYRDTPHTVTINENVLESNGSAYPYELQKDSDSSAYVRLGTKTFYLYDISIKDGEMSYTLDGTRYTLPYKDEMAVLMAKMGFKSSKSAGHGSIKSPMPGKILTIKKQPGDTVSAGETVIVLEAMKMENELKSHVNGTVQSVHASEGQSVEKNTLLLEIQ
jgi:pyruvate carboxylase subunit B